MGFEYCHDTVRVNHYCFHIDDAGFRPGFIKIGTYARYPIKVYLNGHEWVKQQLGRTQLSRLGNVTYKGWGPWALRLIQLCPPLLVRAGTTFLSQGSGRFGGSPRCLVSDHGVEDDEKLAQASHDSDLLGFASGTESFVEGMDFPVVFGGNWNRHIERGADAVPPSPGRTSGVHLAIIPVDGSHAYEAGDLLAIQGAQLG